MGIKNLVNARRLLIGVFWSHSSAGENWFANQKGSKPLARRMIAVEEAPGAAFEEYRSLDISKEKATTRSTERSTNINHVYLKDILKFY